MADAPVRLPRRDFVWRLAKGAGVAPVILGVLDGSVEALPKSEDTDFAILFAALAIEHEAIALYDLALARGLFPAGLKPYAIEFVGDHKGHRDTQIAIVEERGARAPGPLAGYELGRLRSGQAALRACLAFEIAAQKAYLALNNQIRTKDYLLSAAFILVDEVRHMTVWQRVLGLKIY